MLLLVLFFFYFAAEAKVSLTNSEIFDEYDFQTYSVPLTKCAGGCRIYASIPKDQNNYPALNGIVIVDNNKPNVALTSIVQIATMYEHGYKKASRNLPAGNYSVQNINNDLTAAPLVIYVISESVQYFQSVYEVGAAEGRPHVVKDGAIIATFMSVRPYTITSVKSSNGNPISIINAGFDGAFPMTIDNCNIIHQSTGPMINYPIAIRSPLSSLKFGSNAEYSATITFGVDSAVDISTSHSMVATSYGYIGCQRQQSYRSSLYPSKYSLRFQSTTPVPLSITSYRHIPDNTYLQITTSTNENSKMSGKSGVPLNWHLKTNVTWLNFAWAGNADTFFAHIITTKEDGNTINSSPAPPSSLTTTTTRVRTTTNTSPLLSLSVYSVISVLMASLLH